MVLINKVDLEFNTFAVKMKTLVSKFRIISNGNIKKYNYLSTGRIPPEGVVIAAELTPSSCDVPTETMTS